MIYSKPHNFPILLKLSLLKDAKEHRAAGHTLNRIKVSMASMIMLNKHLSKFSLRFEYAVLFKWLANEKQPIHIDGAPPGVPRNSSLNLILRGGEGAFFEWFDAKLMAEPLISSTGIPAFQVDESTACMIHREPLQKCSVVRTNTPHRVSNITTETDLLCIRAYGNPTIDQF